MNESFRQYLESLHPKLAQLLAMPPVRGERIPRKVPDKGVYLFSESGNHLYVGRSNRLRDRLRQHTAPSSDRFNATFAFRMACMACGKRRGTYMEDSSRAKLETDGEFARTFREAKQRVRNMDIRFVEEADALRQTLLEIYAAFVLQTPYNDFETH
jgi:predicted GIY-YIG superfamily endonuclease